MVLTASTQKGVGGFALTMLGLAISRSVRLRRSAAPCDANEYTGVESCPMPACVLKKHSEGIVVLSRKT